MVKDQMEKQFLLLNEYIGNLKGEISSIEENNSLVNSFHEREFLDNRETRVIEYSAPGELHEKITNNELTLKRAYNYDVCRYIIAALHEANKMLNDSGVRGELTCRMFLHPLFEVDSMHLRYQEVMRIKNNKKYKNLSEDEIYPLIKNADKLMKPLDFIKIEIVINMHKDNKKENSESLVIYLKEEDLKKIGYEFGLTELQSISLSSLIDELMGLSISIVDSQITLDLKDENIKKLVVNN